MPSEFINNPMMQFQIEVNKFVTFTNTAQSLHINRRYYSCHRTTANQKLIHNDVGLQTETYQIQRTFHKVQELHSAPFSSLKFYFEKIYFGQICL